MNRETNPEDHIPEDQQAANGPSAGKEVENPPQADKEAEDVAVDKSAAETVAAGAEPYEAAKSYVDPSIAAEAGIAELEAKVKQLQDKYVRALAENDNLRKRTEREKSDIAKYAVTKFAGDMVAIADNLRRALKAASDTAAQAEQSGALSALLEGVALTDQELQKAFEKNGIIEIAANGEIFDPHKHQAVMEQDNSAVPAGTILQVFQDGYQIGDRVLRPSMVVVAKGGAKPVKKSEGVDTPQEATADATQVPPVDEQTRSANDNVGDDGPGDGGEEKTDIPKDAV